MRKSPSSSSYIEIFLTGGVYLSLVQTSSLVSKLGRSSSFWSEVSSSGVSSSETSSIEAERVGRVLVFWGFFILKFCHVRLTGSTTVGFFTFLKRARRLFFFLTQSTSSSINIDFLVAGSASVPFTQLMVGSMACSHGKPSKILSLFASFAMLNFAIMVQSSILTVRMQYQEINPPAASDPYVVITDNGFDKWWIWIQCILQNALLINVPDAPESTTIEVLMVFACVLEIRIAGILSSFLFPSDCTSLMGTGDTDVKTVLLFKNPFPWSSGFWLHHHCSLPFQPFCG